MEPRRFAKTIWCWGSDPVTTDNRQEVLDWVLAWGGHGALTPDGTDDREGPVLLVLYTDHGERLVRDGERVVLSQKGGNFSAADLSDWFAVPDA